MTLVRRTVALQFIERLFLAAGLGLAIWCTAVLIQARYVSNRPAPQARSVSPLPGEGATESSAPAPDEEAAPRSASPSPGAWVAKLEVPSRGLSVTVLEGTDDKTLRLGAGRISSTALPGASGNVGIAGHRDTVFRPLRKVQIGDTILLTTADEVREYRIVDTMVVDPDDVYVLDQTKQPTLTLVTCYPFAFIGSAPQRFIVRADLTATRARGAGL